MLTVGHDSHIHIITALVEQVFPTFHTFTNFPKTVHVLVPTRKRATRSPEVTEYDDSRYLTATSVVSPANRTRIGDAWVTVPHTTNARGARQPDALNQLKMARDNALRPNGSAKGSLGAVFATARRVLGNTERIGENRSQFSSDVLAALIHPDMTVAKELAAVLDLDSVS